MVVYLRFRSATDTMRLDSVSRTGYGVEALVGVTGLGLPPVSTQWRTGAGDGAAYRGERKQPRNIDIPLHILMPDRAGLEAEADRLAAMVMDGPFDLDLIDGGTEFWTARVVRVGGGDYAYGEGTTGERELTTILTVRAGAPWFELSADRSVTVTNEGAGRGLLGSGASLVQLRIASSAAIGDMTIVNEGSAPTWPVWRIRGPGTDLVISNGTHGFEWNGELEDGQELVIDTRAASVKRDGVSRYTDLAPAPRFFPLVRGQNLVQVSMSGTTTASAITATWRPRRWLVI